MRIPVTANRQQTDQVTFSVENTTTRDSYTKCKLKYIYKEKDFTSIRTLPTTINKLHSKAGLVTVDTKIRFCSSAQFIAFVVCCNCYRSIVVPCISSCS